MTKFSGLSAEEEEILDIMQEELAEVIQAISKVKRHGYLSTHPDGGEDNLTAILRELGDLDCILEIWSKSMGNANHNINTTMIKDFADKKFQKLPRYTHHIDWSKYSLKRK